MSPQSRFDVVSDKSIRASLRDGKHSDDERIIKNGKSGRLISAIPETSINKMTRQKSRLKEQSMKESDILLALPQPQLFRRLRLVPWLINAKSFQAAAALTALDG